MRLRRRPQSGICGYYCGQKLLTIFKHILVGVESTIRREAEMPSVTEIYVCKPGQKLQKGKLFTSYDIHDHQVAELRAR